MHLHLDHQHELKNLLRPTIGYCHHYFSSLFPKQKYQNLQNHTIHGTMLQVSENVLHLPWNLFSLCFLNNFSNKNYFSWSCFIWIHSFVTYLNFQNDFIDCLSNNLKLKLFLIHLTIFCNSSHTLTYYEYFSKLRHCMSTLHQFINLLKLTHFLGSLHQLWYDFHLIICYLFLNFT